MVDRVVCSVGLSDLRIKTGERDDDLKWDEYERLMEGRDRQRWDGPPVGHGYVCLPRLANLSPERSGGGFARGEERVGLGCNAIGRVSLVQFVTPSSCQSPQTSVSIASFDVPLVL